ncbi:MAG: DNA replication/repair protein RecF [Roseburia sp.]|nr:DNA replication/repair protein RecF [Roseburia sp.]
MIIHSMELLNFRNYERELFHFDPETNVLFGDNAQGKTNVLEGIYLCSTTRSHKGSKDREMIRLGMDESHLRMVVYKEGIDHKIDVHLKKNKSKGIAVDGIPVKRSGELLGICNIVFFSPEDLAIIQNGPDARRRFIDMELCQLDKMYLFYLTKYKHVLRQRNELLKQISINSELVDTLDIWNSKLIEYGTYVINARKDFVEKLNGYIKDIHKSLTGDKEEIDLIYEPDVRAEDFSEKLILSEQKDLFTKTTNTGPHRDDLSFISEQKDLRKYGSRGQQRTGALSLKLTEIKIVEEKTGEKPILLLDDVLSELDRNRQNYLLEHIKGIQTIITCTGLEEFVKNGINIQKTFEIESGTVK